MTFPNDRVQFMMDIAACLADDTRTASGFARIPGFLGRILHLPCVSLAVIQNVPEGASIFLSAFSRAPLPPSFDQDLLHIHRQTGSATAQEDVVLQANVEISRGDGAEDGSLATFPSASVFTQAIDDRHCMLLIVHQRGDEPRLPAPVMETLRVVARQLGRLLEPLIIWMTRPDVVGAPFDLLTEREWMVLRQLGSDAGEKQLADHLRLSPHTLHSHIKSIYRKAGVQGRLQLMRRMEESMSELRRNCWRKGVEEVGMAVGDRGASAA